MPRRVHRLVQHARNGNPVALDPIIDAMLASGQAPQTFLQIKPRQSQFRIIDKPIKRRADGQQIAFSNLFAMLGKAVIQNLIKIAPGFGPDAKPHAYRRRRARLSAMMLSIVASVSGDASPSSIITRNRCNFSSAS